MYTKYDVLYIHLESSLAFFNLPARYIFCCIYCCVLERMIFSVVCVVPAPFIRAAAPCFILCGSRRLSTEIASLERELSIQLEAGDPTQDAVKECLRRAVTRRRRALGFLEARSYGSATTPTSSAATPAPAPAPTPTAVSSGKKHSSDPPSSASSPWLPLDPGPPHPSAASHTPSRSPSSSSSSTKTPLPPPTPPYDGGLFCSELVAALYQRLGILDAPFPARHDYVPADFAQSLGNPVGCVGGVDGGGEEGSGKSGSVAGVSITRPRSRTSLFCFRSCVSLGAFQPVRGFYLPPKMNYSS